MHRKVFATLAIASLGFLISCGGGSGSSDDFASQYKKQQSASSREEKECFNHFKYVTHVGPQYYTHYYYDQDYAFSVIKRKNLIVRLLFKTDPSRGTNPRTDNAYRIPSRCRFLKLNHQYKKFRAGTPTSPVYTKYVIEDNEIIKYTKSKFSDSSPYEIYRTVFAIPVEGPGNNDLSTLKR